MSSSEQIPLEGILPLDKPPGPTSHDIVAAARRALRIRRIGHTGTLDPFASGLLLLCLGNATRLAEYLTALPKSYTATLRLGAATDTDDSQGTVIATSGAWSDLSPAQVTAALAAQVGTISQTPPRYSAKKVDGERMYAVARRGGDVSPRPVEVQILRIEIQRVALPDVEFEIDCSSGTYIRSVARDVGEALGVGGHLTRLRRTRIGQYSIDAALSLAQLEDAESVRGALVPPAQALSHLPSVIVDAAEEQVIRRGGSIVTASGDPDTDRLAIISASGGLVGIGERRGDRVQPRKVLA